MTDLMLDLGAILALGMFAYGFWSLTSAAGNPRTSVPSRLRASSSGDLTPINRAPAPRGLLVLAAASALTIMLGLLFRALHTQLAISAALTWMRKASSASVPWEL
jgi:hypothetical protein